MMIWHSFLDYRSGHPLLVNLALIVALVVFSGLIGHWLAKTLRAVDYGWKFGTILFALLASIVIILLGWPPRLGVDLGGGSILVYKVDERLTDWKPEKMDALLVAIGKRVNPGGQKEIAVRSLGTNMVQIVMPAVSGVEAEQVRKLISTTGALQFRILATRRDDAELIDKAKAERRKPQYPVDMSHSTPLTVSLGRKKATWVRVREQEVGSNKSDDAAIMAGTIKVKNDQGQEVDKEVWEVLVLEPESSQYDVTGFDVRDASAGRNSENGSPEVDFAFNSEGGVKFLRLTSEHSPIGSFRYRLAIVMDNELQTAPSLESAIGDRGRITGNFTEQKVKEYVDIINAGALPGALEKQAVRDMTTEATLGAETIRQSAFAMIIASIAVPLFMLLYYRFAGLVAVLVLALNMLMLIALMILIKAPFTLPALAGLALTVGMAVDNNVLIYERLREEIHHGAALRMAIRNAFHRVGVVIIDANITHLIAATVLWSVGTEQIKGFAVTFWIGAVLSIWATMFVARVIFEVAERRRWVQRLDMMQWIGHTKIDFMAWFPACATFSVVITVLGILIAVVRGQGLFDIDFTGGVSVQAVFRQEQKIDEIRKQIDTVKSDLPDATVTNAHNQDEPNNYRFIIDTSNRSSEDVKATLKKLFRDQLVTLDLSASQVAVEKPAPSKAEEKTPEKTAPPPVTKPAEMKSAEPKPAAAKPAETKPAETKPPESKPAAAKPAESKPTDSKPGEPKPADTKPADKSKQLRSDLPESSLVAMAGNNAVLLALADAPKAPAAKPETKPEAKPEPKPEDKPQTGVPGEKPAAAAPQGNSAASTPAEESFKATVNLSSVVAKESEGKVTQQDQPVRYDRDRLTTMINQILDENGIPFKEIRVELTNPEDLTRSARWDVKLSPTTESKTPLTEAKFKQVLKALEAKVRTLPYFPIEDNIGSAVANDTRKWAVVALVCSWSLIILYLWIRFQGVAFGLAAVIALIHDVLVMLGAIAFSSYLARIPGLSAISLIEPFKINLPIVAAFLTIIGYSVNDTIVVFDRIREIRGKSPTVTRQMVNDATNQTLSRTVLTSFTVMLVVIILYIFGGQAVHGFAFALIIGVLTGTYSSIYVAAPILLWLLHPKEMSAATAGAKTADVR